MPNIKSAKKRVKVNESKKSQNRPMKTELATAIKNFKEEVKNDKTDADIKYANVCSTIDSACSHGLIHKSNADRKKSRLANYLNKLNK